MYKLRTDKTEFRARTWMNKMLKMMTVMMFMIMTRRNNASFIAF